MVVSRSCRAKATVPRSPNSHSPMKTRLRQWRRPALQVEPVAPPKVVAQLLRAKIADTGSVRWMATGHSMRGAIADGSSVTLRSVSPGDVQPGLVVIAEMPFGLAVHRVRRVYGESVQLRGDARRRADPLIPIHAVIGAVDPAPPFRPRSYLFRLVP